MEIKAAGLRREREQRDRAWLAWHIAALQRCKKMPDLTEFVGEPKRAGRVPWQEQLARMTAWAGRKGETGGTG